MRHGKIASKVLNLVLAWCVKGHAVRDHFEGENSNSKEKFSRQMTKMVLRIPRAIDCWAKRIQFDLTWKGCGSSFCAWKMRIRQQNMRTSAARPHASSEQEFVLLFFFLLCLFLLVFPWWKVNIRRISNREQNKHKYVRYLPSPLASLLVSLRSDDGEILRRQTWSRGFGVRSPSQWREKYH